MNKKILVLLCVAASSLASLQGAAGEEAPLTDLEDAIKHEYHNLTWLEITGLWIALKDYEKVQDTIQNIRIDELIPDEAYQLGQQWYALQDAAKFGNNALRQLVANFENQAHQALRHAQDNPTYHNFITAAYLFAHLNNREQAEACLNEAENITITFAAYPGEISDEDHEVLAARDAVDRILQRCYPSSEENSLDRDDNPESLYEYNEAEKDNDDDEEELPEED